MQEQCWNEGRRDGKHEDKQRINGQGASYHPSLPLVASLGPVCPSLLTYRYVPLRCFQTNLLRLPRCVLLPASKHPRDAVEVDFCFSCSEPL